MEVKDLEQNIKKEIFKNKALIFEIAKYLYDNPEVGFSEIKAKELLTKTLNKHGFRLAKGIRGIETSFRAEKTGLPGGPTIALVAEYDALPGLGHACGHNLIAAGIIGAALAMTPILSELKGSIVVLGTPAEEGGGGKILMYKKGAWEGIDMAISFHPAGVTIVEPETTSVCIVQITIKKIFDTDLTVFDLYHRILEKTGVNGVNLQSQITHGAVSSLPAPGKLTALLKMTSINEKYIKESISNLKNNIRSNNLRAESGLNVQIDSVLNYEKLKSDKNIAEVFRQRLKSMGIKESERKINLGASDLGNISKYVPCLCPLISLNEQNIQLHTKEFARAANPQKAVDTILVAAELLSLTMLDIYLAES